MDQMNGDGFLLEAIPDQKVVRLVKSLGNKGSGGAKRAIPESVLAEIRRLVGSGMFHAQVMRELGVSRGTVRRAITGA